MDLLNTLKRVLARRWREPLALEAEGALDSADTLDRHRRIIEGKPLLQAVYRRWYRDYARALAATENLAHLPAVELGSGAGLVDRYLPQVVKTDVVKHPLVREVVSGEAMPYRNASLRALLMVDVLHHMSQPRRFFAEAVRCLAPGGRVVMVEPMNSWLGRLVWGNFHLSERFEPDARTWESPVTGRLSDANMAVPWIIFFRDRAVFEREFPELAIERLRPHTAIGYYLSGGLSYRPFVPTWMGRGLLLLERAVVALLPFLGTMVTIELRRRTPGEAEVRESADRRRAG